MDVLPSCGPLMARRRAAWLRPTSAAMRRGEALVIDDVTADPRTRDDPAPMLGIGIGALVNIPVRELGRTVAVFIAHAREARAWTADELAFLRNVADRLEAGVARMQAEGGRQCCTTSWRTE